MAISWTKAWQSSDDGTIIGGSDLKNIQDDIDANAGNATTIHDISIDAPVTGDDGFALFYDLGNTKYDWKAFIPLASSNQGDIYYDNGTNMVRLTPGTSGHVLQTKGTSANPVWASVVGRQEFSSSDTFTAPAGVTEIFVTLVGGGGGGASYDNAEGGGGGGGAGGHFYRQRLDVTPSTGYAVTIGTGGAGGTGGNANGSTGVASSFVGDDFTLTCNPGAGGAYAGTGGAGGTATNGGTTVPPDSTLNTGAVGGFPNIALTSGTGSAGGATTGANDFGGGGGGGSLLASGGAGGDINVSGSVGTKGSGGGGGGDDSGNGAAGGDGYCIVEWQVQ